MISNKGLNKLAKIAQEIGGTSGIDSTGEMTSRARDLLAWSDTAQESLDEINSTVKQMLQGVNEVANYAHSLVQTLADPEGLEAPYESAESLDEQLGLAESLQENVRADLRILSSIIEEIRPL